MSRTKEELQEEIQKKKHEEEQLKHREQRAKNRAEYLMDKKRRDRTHRLITRGAALESIIPEVKDMSERPFYLAVENFFSDEDNRQKFCEELTRQTQTAEYANRRITDRAVSQEESEKSLPENGSEHEASCGASDTTASVRMPAVRSEKSRDHEPENNTESAITQKAGA